MRRLYPLDDLVTPRLLLLCALFCLAAGLAGCGRRGPLELPPETQQRGAELREQQKAEARATRARPAPGEDEQDGPPPPIPGTTGNRPPDKYPFVLDPLLQ